MCRTISAAFLFMYFKKLYRQSKIWFVVAVLFAAGQLFINYKHGAEFSPFYHYGMFSGTFQKKLTYEATEVTVNGKRLQAKNFTPNGWDNIVLPITQYEAQKIWNSQLYNTTIKRLLHTKDSSVYIDQFSDEVFNQWYRQRIIRLLHVQDISVIIQYKILSYRQQNDTLYHQ